MSVPTVVDQPTGTFPRPPTVNSRQVDWRNATVVGGFHLIAMLAFIPWLFSWTGLILAYTGRFVFGTLGINLCYHRLLTHRGLTCPKWFEHTLAVLGVCCVQDTPARWIATHRRHHQHADEQSDPHSPLAGFFWSHMGWLLFENRELKRAVIFDSYAKDIVRDPFYMMLERNYVWIVLGSWAAFFLSGFAIEVLSGGTIVEAFQFGLSIWVWGAIIRTVLVWHITWSVNSVAHVWGYRNYDTDEASRNNFFIGIVSAGEGWHNNHHADPRSAMHGHYWWELDVTYTAIRLLSMIGLAQNVMAADVRSMGMRRTEKVITRDCPIVPGK